MTDLRLGIDASNITIGGGLTHLVAFLEDAFSTGRYRKILLWSSSETIAKLPTPPAGLEVEYRSNPALNAGIISRVRWTTRFLHHEADGLVDVLFVPGGLYLGQFRPFVTMCRNMLPFDALERVRFGFFSREHVRLCLLRIFQALTFKRADRLIFLSQYAQREISRLVRLDARRQVIVPHGIAESFRDVCANYNGELRADHLRLVYVSTLMPYKYQLEVVDAVAHLAKKGIDVELDLIGGGDATYITRVRERIGEAGLTDRVHLVGAVPHAEVPAYYRAADAAFYASGCENFPNILVEAMATGLPVISSDRGPMPDILGTDALYFDPSAPESIADALQRFAEMAPAERHAMSVSARQLAEGYSWASTFEETARVIFSCVEGTA
ncbi:MAG: glycosyltransferase family 1 protein [Alcanivoracaceae bacterium]|nr:glycosyltransferase family 1 protein [Alcanivoracaceae bacterium]